MGVIYRVKWVFVERADRLTPPPVVVIAMLISRSFAAKLDPQTNQDRVVWGNRTAEPKTQRDSNPWLGRHVE